MRKHVLIADDHPDAAQQCAQALRGAGHRVDVAFDGATAVHLAIAHRPQVCIIDLALPVRDGYTVARMLRRQFGADFPKLIALTGCDAPEDRERTSAAGFDDHITRPADVECLLARIASWLGEARVHDERCAGSP